MAILHVAAAGTNESPYETWAKAATAFHTATAAAADGDTIYVDKTHNETGITSGTHSMAGTNTAPLNIISATSGTTTYAAGASLSYATGMTRWGTSAASTGLIITSGLTISVTGGDFEFATNIINHQVTYTPAANHHVRINGGYNEIFDECVFTLLGTSFIRTSANATAYFRRCTATNGTGASLFFQELGKVYADDCDFSTLSSGTALFGNNTSQYNNPWAFASGVLLPPSGAIHTTSAYKAGRTEAYAVGTAAADELYQLEVSDSSGVTIDNSSIYLTADDGSGANYSIEITPTAESSYHQPNRVQIFEDYLDANKTITAHVTYDSATRLQDDEVWIEISQPNGTNAVLRDLVSTASGFGVAGTDISTSGSAWTGTGGFSGNKKEDAITTTLASGSAGVHIITLCYAPGASTPVLYVCPDVVIT